MFFGLPSLREDIQRVRQSVAMLCKNISGPVTMQKPSDQTRPGLNKESATPITANRATSDASQEWRPTPSGTKTPDTPKVTQSRRRPIAVEEGHSMPSRLGAMTLDLRNKTAASRAFLCKSVEYMDTMGIDSK